MDGGKRVWVPHPADGFILGKIVDLGSDTITVEPFQTPGQVGDSHFETAKHRLWSSNWE